MTASYRLGQLRSPLHARQRQETHARQKGNEAARREERRVDALQRPVARHRLVLDHEVQVRRLRTAGKLRPGVGVGDEAPGSSGAPCHLESVEHGMLGGPQSGLLVMAKRP